MTSNIITAAMPFPNIDPILFQIGPIAIRWYALAYIAGIVLGLMYAKHLCMRPKLWTSKKSPITPLHLDDFLIWATLGIILGGRLGFVLFYNTAYYIENPAEILKTWEGGMSFHGGFLGVMIATILYTYFKKLPALSFLDLMAAAAPIGLFFGRIANFINAELFGRITDVPWGVVFPTGGDLPRHPSQLYEAALEGILLTIIIALAIFSWKSLKRPGFTAGIFALGYGLSRITVEFVREPDIQLGFLAGDFITMGMVLSLPMALAGLALMLVSKRIDNSRS